MDQHDDGFMIRAERAAHYRIWEETIPAVNIRDSNRIYVPMYFEDRGWRYYGKTLSPEEAKAKYLELGQPLPERLKHI